MPRAPSSCSSSDGDIEQFTAQLEPQGLGVRDVERDGNCLFRAFSNQLYGVEDRHEELRALAVRFMRDHEEDFAPFVEDDRSFAEYMDEIARDGVWAGNSELQALSMACKVNIRIHQASAPCLDVINHRDRAAPVIHLSYHGGEHYASVRPLRILKDPIGARHEPLKTKMSTETEKRKVSPTTSKLTTRAVRIKVAADIRTIRTRLKLAGISPENDLFQLLLNRIENIQRQTRELTVVETKHSRSPADSDFQPHSKRAAILEELESANALAEKIIKDGRSRSMKASKRKDKVEKMEDYEMEDQPSGASRRPMDIEI